ncbi:MAG: hypothetical protein KDB61_01750 [Planctomycetes bacterium]|nr:hypothetical protein [Planctomycetota bacterium]
MKRTVTLIALCATLFACQANPASDTDPSISASDGDGFSSVIQVSSLFSPDGPDGRMPYTCVQAPECVQELGAVHNPGDGCCGPYLQSSPGSQLASQTNTPN